MKLAPDTPEGIAFGRFVVLPHRRELLADTAPIKLGGRAFDLLMVLIETPGAVIDKEDLLTRVWPDRVVAENNLQTQILALRNAFGAERDLIRTIAGRGYQFTGDIRTVVPNPDKYVSRGSLAGETVAMPPNLPQPASELIGRNAELEDVSTLVCAGRLVTLIGAGGIGKTRLALAVGHRLLPHFPDGVWLLELSSLSHASLVPAAVAAAVGLELRGELSAQRVGQALAARRMLLVLDTCEHLIDSAATMVEAVLRAGSAAHVLATSREPLRAEGEQLYSVPPLAVPPEDATDLLQYGAAGLFLERARAAEPGLAPDRAWSTTATAICRRLDGIPLAIEMAAARLSALGIDELARRLEDRLQLLTGGRRTAARRHQTLRATLDWSHELLTDPERVLFRRLAIFIGTFSLEAVEAVAASTDFASSEIVARVSDLAAKSLVVTDVDARHPRYRLLDTTQAYASEQLDSCGERDSITSRHAEYYLALFKRAATEVPTRSSVEWLADYAREIGNLRAALDWAFSRTGNRSLGVALTIAGVPLWLRLSLLEESRRRAKLALGVLEATGTSDPSDEMKLHIAIGASLPDATEMESAFTKALDIAKNLDDCDYQLRALRGLHFYNSWKNNFRAALSFAQRFQELAANSGDQNDRLLGDRMLGSAKYFTGDLVGARCDLERVLTHYAATDSRQPIVQFQDVIRSHHDGRVEARVFLARVLWFQGLPHQARRMAEKALEEAQATGHVSSQCFALALALCPVALSTGDLGAAADYTTLLLDLSAKHSLSHWVPFGTRYRRVIALKGGPVGTNSHLPDGVIEVDQFDPNFRSLTGLTELVEALTKVGRSDEALALLDESAAQSSETSCFTPELLRLRGELLQQTALANTEQSEDLFRQAFDLAHRQGALWYELRAAMSLARLLSAQGRSSEALVILQPVYDRFTEGFETTDLIAAKSLLNKKDNQARR